MKPTKLSVLGQDFAIEWDHVFADGSNDFGETVEDPYTIRVGVGAKRKETRVRVLVHEAVHAAFLVSGVTDSLTDELEESICRCLENALTPLLGELAVFAGQVKPKRRAKRDAVKKHTSKPQKEA